MNLFVPCGVISIDVGAGGGSLNELVSRCFVGSMHACTAVSRGVSVQVPLESFDASRLKEDDVPLFTRGKRVNRRRDQVDYDLSLIHI